MVAICVHLLPYPHRCFHTACIFSVLKAHPLGFQCHAVLHTIARSRAAYGSRHPEPWEKQIMTRGTRTPQAHLLYDCTLEDNLLMAPTY